MRRAAHEALGGDAVENYCPIQMTEALILTDGLLKNASGWDGHIRRYVLSGCGLRLSSCQMFPPDLRPLRSCQLYMTTRPSSPRMNRR